MGNFDVLKMHNTLSRMPNPLPPIDGVKYVAEFTDEKNTTVALTWFTRNKDSWKAILEAVRSLPERSYNAATKKWEVTYNEYVHQWMLNSGWPEPKVFDPVTDKRPDPRIKQKELIDATQLDPEGTLIPGLRSYQIDFLKFAQLRHGRLALGDEMGCIDGNALVQVCRHKASKEMTLAKLYKAFHTPMGGKKIYTNEQRPWYIRCLHPDGAIRLGEIVDVVDSGIKQCVIVSLSDGRQLTLTPDHLIKTKDGWIEASKSKGSLVLCNGQSACPRCGATEDIITYPGSKFKGYCKKCMYAIRNGKRYKDDAIHEQIHKDGYVYLYGLPLRGYTGCKRTNGIPKHRYVMEQFLGRMLTPDEVVHHIDGNKLNNDVSNLELLSHSEHSAIHSDYKHFGFVIPESLEVVDVQDAGMQHVYDVKVLNHGNFLANKIIVHNCGKTVEALSWMVYANAYPALYVVNAPTKFQWQQAYRKWVGATKKHYPDVDVISGKRPYRLAHDKSYIINWDILSYWEKELSQVGFRLMVGDEVQAIGNPDSQRASAFMNLANTIPHVIGMSGTPAMSKPMQFWTLLNIVEPSMFKNFYMYKMRYCNPVNDGYGVKFDGASHVEELHELIVKCMLRRTKSEVMKDLPPKVMEVVPLEVDESAMKTYRDEEAQTFSATSEKMGIESAREKVAHLLRTAYAVKEKSMIQWITDFLESGKKLLLFAWHRSVVEILFDTLKDWNPVCIYGGMTDKQREEARTTFINNPRCKVVVANIQAGGVGIDGFQDVCSDVAFAEFSHTPNYHRQAEDRLHRSGQHNSVTSYYLIAPGTVDNDAVECLDNRAKMLDGVLDGKQTASTDLLTELLERRGVHIPH